MTGKNVLYPPGEGEVAVTDLVIVGLIFLHNIDNALKQSEIDAEVKRICAVLRRREPVDPGRGVRRMKELRRVEWLGKGFFVCRESFKLGDLRNPRSLKRKLDKYCHFCKSPRNLSTDHVKERHLGGTDDPDNLVTACATCQNLKKSGKAPYDSRHVMEGEMTWYRQHDLLDSPKGRALAAARKAYDETLEQYEKTPMTSHFEMPMTI